MLKLSENFVLFSKIALTLNAIYDKIISRQPNFFGKRTGFRPSVSIFPAFPPLDDRGHAQFRVLGGLEAIGGNRSAQERGDLVGQEGVALLVDGQSAILAA